MIPMVVLDVPVQAWWIVGVAVLCAGLITVGWLVISGNLNVDRINSFLFPEKDIKPRRGYPNAHGVVRQVVIPVEGSEHGEMHEVLQGDEGIVESRDERGKITITFSYRGPSHTIEHAVTSWHGYEIEKLRTTLSGDVIRFRILGKDGRDQRTEEMLSMQRVIDRQTMALALAEEKLDELSKDTVVQKIRKVQRRKAVDRAGSMEAQGRDNNEEQKETTEENTGESYEDAEQSG